MSLTKAKGKVLPLESQLKSSTGASSVGTSSGYNVQESINNLSVPSYAALKALTPKYAGQIVTMTSYYTDWASAGWVGQRGGKNYVAIQGTAIEDGGFICVPTTPNGFYWKALVDELNLFDFGVKVSDRQVANSAGLIDTTTELKNAIASSIKNKLPLRSSLFVRRSGYAIGQSLYIKSGIDITGIKEMTGIYALVYKPSEFTGAKPLIDDDIRGCGYVVVNMNCDWGTNGKLYGTSYGEQVLGTITDYSLEGRNASYPMNGQIHCFSGSQVQMLASIASLGYGVRLTDTYDSVIQDIRALFSGVVDPTFTSGAVTGIERPGWCANTYTKFDNSADESNALTIVGAVAHNNYDMAWSVSGTKNTLLRVHEEGTYVTTQWRSNPSNNANNNGFGYANSYFTSLGGSLGTVAISPTSSNPFKHCFTYMGWGDSVDNLAGENIGLAAGFAVYGGSVSSIRCTGDLIIQPNARTTVSHVSIGGNVQMKDDASAILGGVITGTLTTSGAGKISRTTISGAVTVAAGFGVIEACSLNSDLTVTSGLPTITGNRILGNANLNGSIVDNCQFLQNVTVNPGTIQINNSRITGSVTSTNTGDTFFMNNCVVNGTFTGGGRISNTYFSTAITAVDSLSLTLDNVHSVNTLNIQSTNMRVYVRGGRFDKIVLNASATGTWELFPAPMVNTTVDNWLLPTLTTGLGRMTINPTTNKIYTLVGGTWAEYTTH